MHASLSAFKSKGIYILYWSDVAQILIVSFLQLLSFIDAHRVPSVARGYPWSRLFLFL